MSKVPWLGVVLGGNEAGLALALDGVFTQVDPAARVDDLNCDHRAALAELIKVGCLDHALRATVSEVAERQSLDAKAAEAKLRELGVDGRWFSKNQKTSRGYTTVKVVARKA